MRKISNDQIVAKIQNENPWWSDPHQIQESISKLKPRPYLTLLEPLVTQESIRRAVVLMGPRRVGKTVLIHHLIGQLISDGIHPQRICYFSVDHPIYNGLSLEDFIEYFRKSTGIDFAHDSIYIFFDEIQYLKNWETHLKSIVDTYYKNVKILVSGSAAAALRLKSSESGAGRFTDFILPPLTFYEYLYLLDDDTLVCDKIDGKDNWVIEDPSEFNNR
ncbi:AAA family ATPase, partial [Planctomycetota bacterium]